MKSHRIVCAIIPLVFLVSLAQARDVPRFIFGGEVIHGGSVDMAKAGADTINLMASHQDPTNGPGEPTYFGDFEDTEGNPDWNGWTHYDITQRTETHWNVSTYNQPDPGNHAAWCGDITFRPVSPMIRREGTATAGMISWNSAILCLTQVPVRP